MSIIINIAKQVAEKINGNEFSIPFTAAYDPIPRQDLQSVKGIECFVYPDSMRRTAMTRTAWALRPVVQVGILKHIDKLNRAAEIETLCGLVEEVTDFLARAVLDNNIRVVEFGDSPAYFVDHLQQFSVFSSVITAVYSAGVRNG